MDKFTRFLAVAAIGFFCGIVAFNASAETQSPMEKKAVATVEDFYGNGEIKAAVCNKSGECAVNTITGDRITLKCDASGKTFVCIPK